MRIEMRTLITTVEGYLVGALQSPPSVLNADLTEHFSISIFFCLARFRIASFLFLYALSVMPTGSLISHFLDEGGKTFAERGLEGGSVSFEGEASVVPDVFTMRRGPAYNFTAREREKVPCWSDYELLQDIRIVLISERSRDTSLNELSRLSAPLLRRKARSLRYISRRTNRSKALRVSGTRVELVARILSWQHVKDSGSYLFVSRE